MAGPRPDELPRGRRGYIALSHGRDFADCPIERGVFVGGARQSMSVSVRVTDDASLTW